MTTTKPGPLAKREDRRRAGLSVPIDNAADTEHHLKAAVSGAERYGRWSHRRLEPLESLVYFYVRAGRLLNAESLQREILEIREKLLGAGHESLVAPLLEWSGMNEPLGRAEDAQWALEQAIKIAERATAGRVGLMIKALGRLGRVTARRGRWDHAEAAFHRGQKMLTVAAGVDPLDVVRFFGVWADVALWEGHADLATRCMYEAERHLSRTGGGPGVARADVAIGWGHIARAEKKWAAAEKYYKRALLLHESTEGAWGLTAGADHGRLGGVALARGAVRTADAHLRRAQDIRENVLGTNHPEVADVLGPRADAVEGLGRFEEAEEHYKRAWRIYEKCFGPESPALLKTINNLAELYYRRSADAEAERLLRAVVPRAEKVNPLLANRIWTNLMIAYESQDRADDAAAVRDRLTGSPARRTVPRDKVSPSR